MENREKRIKKEWYLGILLGMCLLFPVLLLMGECFGFYVRVRSWGVHSVMFTLIFILLCLRVLRDDTRSGTGSVLSCLLVPASVVHAAVWMVGFARVWLAALLSLVWVVFSAIIMIKNVRSLGAKIAVYLPSALILLPTMLFMLFLPFAWGYRMAVRTITSPERNYRAEVIDVNEGALGGATIVEVYDLRKQFDGVIFLFQKEPQVVYHGDWGEFETMKLEWESEQVLLINGHPNKVE